MGIELVWEKKRLFDVTDSEQWRAGNGAAVDCCRYSCPEASDGAYRFHGGCVSRPGDSVASKHSPDEVTESQNQNGNTCELKRIREVGIELFNVRLLHGRQAQRSIALGEGYPRRVRDTSKLPEGRPVQWIVRIVAWLRHEHVVRIPAFHEMVIADIFHDLSAR